MPQPKAYGYIRVSSGVQVENNSLETQKRMTKDYFRLKLQARGFQWGGNFADPAVSAKEPFDSRSGGYLVSVTLKAGDALVVMSLDRAFRSLSDCLQMISHWGEKRIEFHSCRENVDMSSPSGRLMLHVLAAFAEFDNSVRAERRKAGNDERRARNLPLHPSNGVCFGLDLLGSDEEGYWVAPNGDEIQVCFEALDLLMQGLQIMDITTRWQAEGRVHLRSGEWVTRSMVEAAIRVGAKVRFWQKHDIETLWGQEYWLPTSFWRSYQNYLRWANRGYPLLPPEEALAFAQKNTPAQCPGYETDLPNGWLDSRVAPD